MNMMLSNMLSLQFPSTPLSNNTKTHIGLSFHKNNCGFITKKVTYYSLSETIFKKIPASYGICKSLQSIEAPSPPPPPPPSSSSSSSFLLATTEAITTVVDGHRLQQRGIDHENIKTKHQKSILPGDLRQELMPKHVAVMMDGHGRWAKNKGLPTQYGHYVGFMVRLKELIFNCCRFGIQVFTIYSFSSENWSRPKEEIDCLMNIFEDLIQSQVREMIYRHDLRFSVIGEKTKLPKSLQHAIFSAEESSKFNKGLHFVMAISYSGQNEVTEAVKNIAQKIEDGTLRAKDINVSMLEQQLQTSNTVRFPNVDLLIRTSGELRLSNFMLWQSAYAEFYFCDKLLPDFEEDDFIEALKSFQQRKRRYGGRKV